MVLWLSVLVSCSHLCSEHLEEVGRLRRKLRSCYGPPNQKLFTTPEDFIIFRFYVNLQGYMLYFFSDGTLFCQIDDISRHSLDYPPVLYSWLVGKATLRNTS